MKKDFVLHPVPYMIFFIAGTALFFYLSWNVQVPVYQTVEGCVHVEERDARIVFDGAKDPSVDRIFYYIQRDEWIETAERKGDEDPFRVENVHGLKDGQEVMVDIQVGDVSLLQAILSGT